MSHTPANLARSLGPAYTVDRELGGGGMSRVYLAYDQTLQRRIVVKLLESIFGATSLERFKREILVTARLVHPNIVPLLAVGDVDGVPFYTMPYIEGQSLRTRLDAAKQLDVAEAVRIARDVAKALDFAHRQHIVHRDIKPDNVLLHDGSALVTDFGIAHVAAMSGFTGDSGIGTLAYMSPEQFANSGIDGRADLYSLGCMLFEMLAGHAPYRGQQPQAVAHQHFSAPVPDVRSLRADVPESVADVIATAMAKSPSDRFATAAEMAAALEGTADAPRRASQHVESIAVLPFANMTPDAGNDYFCDGITEEILTALTRLDGLRVAARTSAFGFRGKDIDLREMARVLNVRYVLQGSIRVAGQQLRVSAQLVEAAGGFQLWSEKYDRELRDVFAVQDEIAESIAAKLATQLVARQPVARTTSVEAHDLYLRGRHEWNLGTPDSWRRAQDLYEQAIARDPRYADPYIGLAEALCNLSFFVPIDDVAPRARAAVAKALELEPSRAEAVTMDGFIKCWFDWDFAGAVATMQRAVELNPSSAPAHFNYTFLLANLGRTDDAIAHARQALELDPLWVGAHLALQYALVFAGRYEQSIARGKIAAEMAPGAVQAALSLAWAYDGMKDYDAALATLDAHLALFPGNPFGLGGKAVVLARAGQRDAALETLKQLHAAPPNTVAPALFAWTYAALGQPDDAFEWIEKGVRTKDQMSTCMPQFHWWDPLRGDSRFASAMRRAGFPA